MWLGRQTRGVHTRGDGQAVRQWGGAAGVVPFIDAVGRRCLASPPHDGLLQGGDGHRERHWRVTKGGVHAAGVRDTAAAQGGDATAAAAGASWGVQHQTTGGQAINRGWGQGRHERYGCLHTIKKG